MVFSEEHLKPALLISLLSVWVLVGVFHFLNTYTRRRYFTIWTAAWLFYALWLTLYWQQSSWGDALWHVWLKEWCLCVSAVFLLWGSLRFLGRRVHQRLECAAGSTRPRAWANVLGRSRDAAAGLTQV